MGDWAYLRKSDTELEARSEVTAAPVLLRAKYYVPNLFPALFAQEDFATPSRRSWFQTPLSEAVRRLRRLGTHAAGDSCLSVFWEACIPVAAWLESFGPAGYVVLDTHELVGMTDSDSPLTPQLMAAAAKFSALAAAWSGDEARALLPDWLRSSDVGVGSRDAERWTRQGLPRAAFFSVAFGWPEDKRALAEHWLPWFEAGPKGAPLPDPQDEATRLRRLLSERGLVVFSEQPAHQRWIPRYLVTALRERTPQALAQVLGVMQAQGMIREWLVDRSLEEVLTELDASP